MHYPPLTPMFFTALIASVVFIATVSIAMMRAASRPTPKQIFRCPLCKSFCDARGHYVEVPMPGRYEEGLCANCRGSGLPSADLLKVDFFKKN